MALFDLAAVFLAIVAVAGWVNARFLHRPPAAVMVLAGLASAGVLFLVERLPHAPQAVTGLIREMGAVDFPKAVIGYLLAFLLFAGAMQVNLPQLRQRLATVAGLATLGVAASTLVVGLGLWGAARWLELPLDLPWAFVFGALISPTDPVAVLAAVKQGDLNKSLQAVLQGEALFNDGVGIVVFTAAVAVATGAGDLSPLAAIGRVAVEALGGLALGWISAQLVMRAMRAIDDYAVEVSLSLALAVGVYSLAGALGLSGPIAVVMAGLLVGDCARKGVMSETTERHLHAFWSLIDENLNAVLFLLLGLELLAVEFDARLAGLWAVAVVLVLATRIVVVLPWGAFLRRRHGERGAVVLLTWGGLHGALSVAMAMSIPAGPARSLVLSVTFIVAIASVLVQGLTFGGVAAWVGRRNARTSHRSSPSEP
jgi:CPA1 family monovalent cation:H+ antiporter